MFGRCTIAMDFCDT